MDDEPELNTSDKGVIHIVDDERDIVTVVSRALQGEGYLVHSFSDAAKALEDIELKCRKKVRMLITDIRMPGYSGFEIARRTRQIVPDVPVLFMTAFEINMFEFEKVFPSLGGLNAFIQKPVTIKRLIEVVKANDIR